MFELNCYLIVINITIFLLLFFLKKLKNIIIKFVIKLIVIFSNILVSIEDEQFEIVPLTPEKVLELIEQAYPNPITPDDLAR